MATRARGGETRLRDIRGISLHVQPRQSDSRRGQQAAEAGRVPRAGRRVALGMRAGRTGEEGEDASPVSRLIRRCMRIYKSPSVVFNSQLASRKPMEAQSTAVKK